MGRSKLVTSSLSSEVPSPTVTASAAPTTSEQQQQQAIMVRSLRRRFWHAFQREDAEAAMVLYQATRRDYELWERQQAALEEKQAHQQRRTTGWMKLLPNKKRGGASRQAETFSPLPPSGRQQNDSSSSVGLLQLYMNPSDPFDLDDYVSPNAPFTKEEDTSESSSHHARFRPRIRRASDPSAKASRRRSSSSRQPGQSQQPQTRSWRSLGLPTSRQQPAVDDEVELDPNVDPRMTTPLHEAARLGHGPLVRLLLQQEQADPNARNGVGRTAVHMVAGGLTADEASWLQASVEASLDPNENNEQQQALIGIREPLAIVPEPVTNDGDANPAAIRAKTAAKAVGRFFRDTFAQGNANPNDKDGLNPAASSETQASTITEEQWQYRVQDRMDAALSILSWCHRDDGTDRSGEGPSTNAVDSRGRTALHYAAELGRSDICRLVLSSFGTMLTIIDDHARTPCELAAERKHDDLAAHLEASALLYLDPYGVDDELLAAALSGGGSGGSNGKSLAPPFSWFETWSPDKVQEERCRRIDVTLKKMRKIVKMLLDDENARSLMFQDIIDDTDTKIESAKVESPKETQSLNVSGEESPPPPPPPPPPPAAAEEDQDGKSPLRSSDTSSHTVDSTMETLRGFEHLSKSHVELFLAAHQWKVKTALKAFFQLRAQAFRDAHVPLPVVPPSLTDGKSDRASDQTCLICCEEFELESPKWRTLSGCQHSFCADCLGDYIVDCAKSKSSGLAVLCPHHECQVPLDQLEVINLSPSSEVYGSLIETANENFVVSASDVRFCPHPGCTGVVKFNCPPYVKTAGLDPDLLTLVGGVCTAVHGTTDYCLPTYEGVRDPNYFDCQSKEQPKQAHRFCFQCGELDFHWPVPCDKLEEWKTEVQETVQDVDEENGNETKDYNDVAQKLWMKANTRPCPKCKAPIEKNEGCNHMTCSNPHCRYEFCWICRNDWKLHNTETGGFFRCNRWEEQKEHQFYDDPPPAESGTAPPARHRIEDVTDPSRMEITYGTAMHEARITKRRSRDMARFLHHYRRFNAHAESSALERNMSQTVCRRLAPVVEAAVRIDGSRSFNFGGKGLSFLHAAFTELLECRSMLQHSYAFSFFRYKSIHPTRYRLYKRRLKEKLVFEQLQSELELMTEHMSNVAARSHIRATQAQITFLTVETANKRKEVSNFMINVLSEEQKEDSKGLDGSSSHSLRGGTSQSLSSRSAHARLGDTGGQILRESGHARLGDGLGRSLRESSGLSRRRGGGMLVSDLDDRILGTETPESGAGSRRQSTSSNEEQETERLEEALRASLEEFRSSAHVRDVVDVDDEDGNDGQQSDWPCTACTFMNSGGNRCEMCETPRR